LPLGGNKPVDFDRFVSAERLFSAKEGLARAS
jgi:hypothetical protein